MSQPEADGRWEGQALVGRAGGDIRLERVWTARMEPTDIAVQTLWSGVSIGTEFAILGRKLDRGRFPLVTGYMATGKVVAVGGEVNDFAVGDQVYYRKNRELRSEQGDVVDCVEGAHCSVAVFDPSFGPAGAARLPDGVRADVGSLFVMPAVGLNGVNMADVEVGSTAVVVGVGMIGLGVVAACVARGARVLAVDKREAPLRVARSLGAEAVVNSTEEDMLGAVERFTGRSLADFVFECTGIGSNIDPSVRLCRKRGCFVWQGNYGEGEIEFTPMVPHKRHLRMIFPANDGGRACTSACVQAIQRGHLNWAEVITHYVRSEDGPEFFRGILTSGSGDIIGAVLDWRHDHE